MKIRAQIQKLSRGFSLLEIMLALTIFAMVLTAIYASWMSILRATKVGSEAAADVQRSRIAMQTLEDSLSCARSFAADVNHYSFVGENGQSATLSFVAHLPESFPRSGKFGDLSVRRVTFSLEPGPDSQSQLVMRQNPILMDPDKDEVEHPVVLARDVKGFDMEFWDQKAGDWIEEWTQTNQMPLMIEVSLEFKGVNSVGKVSPSTIVSRTISLPSMMVSGQWQMPNVGKNGGGGGGGVKIVPPGGGKGGVNLQ